MSLLPAEVHTALASLLTGLVSPDNNIRTQAEEQLNNEWIAARPDVLLVGLVVLIQEPAEEVTRSFAAVLFRRIAARNVKASDAAEPTELFSSLPQELRLVIRTRLLECLAKEEVSAVRHKVGDAVAELARQYTDRGEQWPELLQQLFTSSQSPEADQRESAFRIFTTTPGVIETQHEDIVLAAFKKGFEDGDCNVKISAMEAFSAFFSILAKKAQKKYYPLVADLLNILPPLKAASDSENLSKALLALIELAEEAPIMFRTPFRSLVAFSVSVISDKDLEDQTRQNALELMGTFADSAASMCKKDASYTSDMVTQCLSLMTDVGEDDDDAAEWLASEDLDGEDNDLNHVAGEQTMDRLANKLGGKEVLPPAFTWLPRMISSQSWRDRHAALMAISAISEGCRDIMVDELGKVLEMVVPALRDPHPRVKWAGCNALGQMSTDFAGTMQENYHQVVLPNIIPVLDSAEPRIQSHAAAALVNFCEEAEKHVLEPYLDDLLGGLLRILASPQRYVQEQALSTIATIADSAEIAFAKYYNTLMPVLFNVLKEESSSELRLVRAKAMECATLIALAVGKERMGADATNLVQLLGHVQQTITDPSDPQSAYLLHCWGRMCRVLGRDFVPYLAGVMPPLLAVAQAKADILLVEDEDQAKMTPEEGWELVPVKGKIIGIKTSTLEDKHMAIELISTYAQNLEDAFESYVPSILEQIALPSLAFFFHDPTRIVAAQLIPVLLNAVKKAHGASAEHTQNLWALSVEKILSVLTAEPAIDTLAVLYQCFYESVEVMGKNCLSSAHMQAFVEATKGTLEDYQSRVQRRAEEQQDIDQDEEEPEETRFAIEDDQTLLSDMNKAFHTVFRNQEISFLPAWSTLLPYYTAFVTSHDATQRQWALCIFDDVLEFGGEQSWTYHQQIETPMLEGLRDPIAANRQAACYGVGAVALKGSGAWAAFMTNALPLLFNVCQMPDAREDDNVFATENACAAIAKILQSESGKAHASNEVIQHWLTTLPITNDEEAGPYAYMFLATLITRQHPAVMAAASHCFISICQALESETIQGQTAQRVVNAAKQLVQMAGLNANQALVNQSPELQQIVRNYFAQS